MACGVPQPNSQRVSLPAYIQKPCVSFFSSFVLSFLSGRIGGYGGEGTFCLFSFPFSLIPSTDMHVAVYLLHAYTYVVGKVPVRRSCPSAHIHADVDGYRCGWVWKFNGCAPTLPTCIHASCYSYLSECIARASVCAENGRPLARELAVHTQENNRLLTLCMSPMVACSSKKGLYLLRTDG